MVNAGNTTPITYEIAGRQYVVIAAFGGYDRRPGAPAGGRGQSPLPMNVGEGSPTGGAFIAFALPCVASDPSVTLAIQKPNVLAIPSVWYMQAVT